MVANGLYIRRHALIDFFFQSVFNTSFKKVKLCREAHTRQFMLIYVDIDESNVIRSQALPVSLHSIS